MSLALVRAALEKRLAALSPPIDIAFENMAFEPVVGTPYQKANLLRASPDNAVMGSGMFEEIGIFQVTLLYPENTGPGAADARAQLVRDWFKRGMSFTEGGITTLINRTAYVHPGRSDGDRWSVPVDVRWHAYIQTP